MTASSVNRRIRPEEVRHVARLARLDLTEEEVEELTGQLGAILELAARIQGVDTEGVPLRSHPVAQCNVLREDEPRGVLGQAGLGQAGLGQAGLGQAGLGQAGLGQAGLDRTEVLAAAPATEAYRFRVPPILEVG